MRQMRSPDDHIFALNCLLATRDTLQKYPFAIGRKTWGLAFKVVNRH